MALGTTNISTSVVNTALGSPYTTPRSVSLLCKHSNVNPCSFGRPGLWDIDGTSNKFIFFQAPRGLSYTDPRGSYNGSTKESYNLGDFRFYNHPAITPYGSFPASTIDYGSTITTATGSITVYVGEIDWKQTSPAHYSENDWPSMTNVHLIDSSTGTIIGTAAIPSSGGNVSIGWSISMPSYTTYTKTYHIAFGVDATHWSFKMGSAEGLGGIGSVSVRRLAPPAINHLQFDDTYFTGGANDPYTSVALVSTTNTNRFSGNTAIWDYSGLNNWRCYYLGGDDDYRNITATWYIKGFIENSATEYEVKTAAIASNGANNIVDLASMVDSPPRGYWKDGDNMTLILRNLTINY